MSDLAKSLPLYAGGLLVAAAIAGAAASLLRPAPPPPSQAPPPARAEREAARAEREAARVEREAPPAKPELSPDQVKAQDEEDLIKILLEQIAATPEQIDAAWLDSFCVHIEDGSDLDAFWVQVVAEGRSYSAGYTARHETAGKVLSRNPLYYVFEARELLYTSEPRKKSLRGAARGLLAMAVFKSWEQSRVEIREQRAKQQRKRPDEVVLPDSVGTVGDDVKTAFFQEYIKLFALLEEIAVAEQDDPRQYMDEQIRLHEAAIVDRHLGAVATREAVRERYQGSSQSSAPAAMAVERWQHAVNQHLLSLGKIYIDAALAERAFKGRQQAYADRGFQALAMVYQRSTSGAALGIMREANRILRYNLWQMARVSWKRAKQAAAAGSPDEAESLFLEAKHRYLKCLSRLERSKKPVVFDEYKQLQADITAFMQGRGAEILSDTLASARKG